jgi:hypothetical protein
MKMGGAEETRACERCGKEHDIETSVASEDCYFCRECFAEWLKLFETCKHEWQSSHDQFGEPSQYCWRCCGLVNDVDMSAVVG